MARAGKRKQAAKAVSGWLLVGWLAGAAWAAEPTVSEVISLRHRSVDQVLPVVQALVGAEGVVTGIGHQLVVRATPQRLAEIRRVIERIDTPPRRLLISVRQDSERDAARREGEIAGGVRIDDEARGTAAPSERTDDRGLDAVYSSGDARLRGWIAGRQEQTLERNTQTLQVLEGSEAFIQVGTAAPVPERTVVQTPYGTRIVDRFPYREAATGLYVRPRVAGDSVVLSIRTVHDRFSGELHGGIDTQQVETQISTRLGEWIELSGVVWEASRRASALLSRGQEAGADRRRILIKVDELR